MMLSLNSDARSVSRPFDMNMLRRAVVLSEVDVFSLREPSEV
jgi:hypothetical protein